MKGRTHSDKKEVPEPESLSTTETSTALGAIKIHESVITTVVHKAACSVKGVSRLAGSTFMNNIAEMMGSRKIHDRAISLKMDEDNVQIELKINLEYGCRVPEVASKIQTSVAEEVEKLTGMNVVRVDVLVQELEAPVEDEDEEILSEIRY